MRSDQKASVWSATLLKKPRRVLSSFWFVAVAVVPNKEAMTCLDGGGD